VSHRRPLYFFTFMGFVLLDIVLLDAALVFHRRTFAYQWLNRLGVMLGLILTFGFFFWAQSMSLRKDWDGTRTSRWVARVCSLIIPIVFILKLSGRIPEAFWLR
jgi:hypothetical protein